MSPPPRLNALMYHDILLSGSGSRYCFTLAEFREHLSAIAKRVGGAPAIAGADGERAGYALTFDDGCAGWLPAAEELAARRWRAHFFVITGALGTPGRLARPDVRRLAAMGHAIGSHTVDHPAHFASRDEDYIRKQWQESKADLEDILGREVISASVPGGGYNERVARSAEESGLSLLFTSEPVAIGWNVGRCRVLGRYALLKGMSSRKIARLAAGARTAMAGRYLVWNVKKAVKSAFLRPPGELRARRDRG